MSSYIESKPLSLIERKKQQWARERDEMASLTAPWGTNSEKNSAASRTRNRHVSNPAYNRKCQNSSERRSSLPPLHRNHNYDGVEKIEKDMGGETSGYGSDNAPEHHQSRWNHQAGYESSSSFRDDRLKWGDRGVGVGKFWMPREITDYDKVLTTEAPNWVKRGLQRDGELVVSNTSPAESPEQDYGEHDRPCTASTTTSQQARSYIRGQNIPVEPLELAEREKRRQIAMAHQEAIRQQLEEREKNRRQERERRLQEEREEELRIERERQMEMERREIELRRLREKQEKEKQRKEALQEALKLAEKDAKEKKDKQKLLKQNINESIAEKSKSPSKDELTNNSINMENNLDSNCKSTELNNISNSNNNLSRINEIECNNNKLNNKENEMFSGVGVETKSFDQNNETIMNKAENTPSPNSYRSLTPRQPHCRDNLAFLMQTPSESLQGMQFAVLMPNFGTNFTQGIPIAVPVNLANETIIAERTENRLLTPTIYRNKQFCNSSTQTEFVEYNKNDTLDHSHLSDKFSNMDLHYENRSRRNRMRNEDRNTCREIIVEDRPKWGANRPPTRYLKQSEKDPLYQRRKLRQKMREVQVYRNKSNNYSPHSSDDSQTASPVAYRRNGYVEKRRSRALWRRNDHLFARNISVYQTEIIPLESDKDQIYYKSHLHKCCCQCLCEKSGQPIKNFDRSNGEENLPSERCKLPQSMSCISNGD